jgi:hypothetical protein
MKVKVTTNVQIVHGGTVYGPGDVIDSPDDDANNIATTWVDAGWAEVVPDKPPGKAVPAKAAPRKRTS